jgi:hypothetical protein
MPPNASSGSDMTLVSTVRVPTLNASRYLQQLCKHWAHKLDVSFTPEAGHVVFPRDARGADWPDAARLDLKAAADALECRLQASHPEQLAGLKEAVARHLDRFAFREAPLSFAWADAEASTSGPAATAA